MPKRSLSKAKSSPATSTRDDSGGGDKEMTKTKTALAPSFFEDYLNYHYFGEDEGEDEDEIQDKPRRGSFRNRLFSTWTRRASPKTTTTTTTSTPPPSTNKLGCQIVDKWQDGRQAVKRKSNGGAEEVPNEDEDGDGEEDEDDVDSGYAWIILIVMFVINGSTFGTARAYGLIFENSARRDEQSRSDAALPFTIMGAVENMAGPLTGYLLARTGSWRVVVFLGSCLITLSHLLAAYCDSQAGQILTIGLMCGIGQSFVSISSFQINNAYFVRYRSRAFGIGLTGAALGTFYISPLCQFVLDNHTKSLCYLMLGFILLPNVPLSLLLKPKQAVTHFIASDDNNNNNNNNNNSDNESPNKRNFAHAHSAEVKSSLIEIGLQATSSAELDKQTPVLAVFSISNQLRKQKEEMFKTEEQQQEHGFWHKVGQVLTTPVFHLIWPTQLLFCWLNFVFGMIITDFGKDKGLNETQNSHLIVIWASGQLFGRLCLGSLIDLRILSYKSFTMLCFASISLITLMLNNFAAESEQVDELASNMICLLVFVLSMFISTLYILFNGLVVNYMDKSLIALSIGISSFTGSFFLLPRASIIGYYRDTYGNYDAMLTMFTFVTLISALVWLIMPGLCSYIRKLQRKRSVNNCTGVSQVNELLKDCSISSSSSGHTISISAGRQL